MAKYFGKIGFSQTVENPSGSGIWTNSVIERDYYGDVNRDTRRWASASKANDDFELSNEVSIVSDSFAINNTHLIKYVTLNGAKWKISNVEVQYPRLILSLGGLYNG